MINKYSQQLFQVTLFGPPLRVTALIPRGKLHGNRCAALWVLIADDGRSVTTFAMNFADAGQLARELLPDAELIRARQLRSEIGTPLL